jgi:hypothetical protein
MWPIPACWLTLLSQVGMFSVQRISEVQWLEHPKEWGAGSFLSHIYGSPGDLTQQKDWGLYYTKLLEIMIFLILGLGLCRKELEILIALTAPSLWSHPISEPSQLTLPIMVSGIIPTGPLPSMPSPHTSPAFHLVETVMLRCESIPGSRRTPKPQAGVLLRKLTNTPWLLQQVYNSSSYSPEGSLQEKIKV